MNGGGKERLFYILGDRRDAHLRGCLFEGGGGIFEDLRYVDSKGIEVRPLFSHGTELTT